MSSDLKKINKNPYRHNGEITLLKNKRGSNNLLEKKLYIGTSYTT